MLSLGLRFSIPLASSLLCFFFVASPSFGQSPAPSAPDITSVGGTVLNTETHEPIAHALVVSPDNRFAAFTDVNGHFEFKISPSESAAFSNVSEENRLALFMTLSASFQVRKPGFLPGDLLSSSGADNLISTAMRLFLTPESFIIGHVTLPSSNGFDRIQVELLRRDIAQGADHWNSLRAVTTKSDGTFRFAELEAGTYKVLTHELLDRDPLSFAPGAQAWGYPPVYYSSASDFETAVPIELAPGTTVVADFSPSRREYYNVKIKVVNGSEGLPLEVQVWPQGRQSPGYSLAYDSSQQLLQGLLPDGNYLIRVTSSSSEDDQASHGLSGALNLTVKGGGVENQSVALLPNMSIAVAVREEFQHPETRPNPPPSVEGDGINTVIRPPYLEVSLSPDQAIGSSRSSSVRRSLGSGDQPPTVENVEPGAYRVMINSRFGYVASVSCGGIDLTTLRFVVPPVGTAPPIEVVVRDDGAEVTGTVEGLAQSSAGAKGYFQRSSRSSQTFVYFLPVRGTGAQFRMTWGSPDGSFHLQQVPPGEYRVLAFNRQHPELEFATADTLKKYEDKMRPVTLAADQKASVRVSLLTSDE